MAYLNRFFSGRGISALLLITAFCLLAAACWFLGPWVGFGQARPLASSAARWLTIATMLVILLLYWYRLPSVLPLTVGCLTLIWLVGPFILIGKSTPLAAVGYRLALMTVVLLAALIYGVWRLLGALAQDPTLLSRWAKKNTHVSEEKIDSRAINSEISGAVRYMQRIQRALPMWRRFFIAGHHQSLLPWFLVMGTPSAGKTALLFSSGQEFPLPEQLNRVDKENPPTNQCECLFTNQALFVDTSGQYSLANDQAQQGWQSLVETLKKHRPIKGINGVILTLSSEDLLHKTQAERLTLAATLRGRLDALRSQLGVRFPVYVVITKLDLLTGFDQYFRNLTANQRQQVWGITLPWTDQPAAANVALTSGLQAELQALKARLNGLLDQRLQEEYDVSDRKRMYALPHDFGVLCQAVGEVVQNIFFASRYDASQFHATLRGVYFVSNCQPQHWALVNNQTLIQRWNNLSQQKITHTAASLSRQHEDEALIGEGAWAKHYFTTQLFRDLIGNDGDLVSHNLQRHSQYWAKNLVGHLLIWGLACWLCLALVTSYQLNRDYLQQVGNKLSALTQQASQFVKQPSVSLLPDLLAATQQLSQASNLQVQQPPQSWRFGLYTGYALAEGSDHLYHFFLRRYLLPQTQSYALQQLTTALQANDDDKLWLALKRYLMLSGEGSVDIPWLVEATSQAWQQNGAIQAYSSPEVFANHLRAMLAEADWQQYAQPADQTLIKMARQRLAQRTSSERIWQRLKPQLLAQAASSLTLRSLLGADTPALFTSDNASLLQNGIPAIYTREGWQSIVKKKLWISLLKIQKEDSWVLGQANLKADPMNLYQGVLGLYLDDYSRHWQQFLQGLRLISVDNDSALNDQQASLYTGLLRTLVADNSPLRRLLVRVVTETTLVDKAGTPMANPLNVQSALLQQAQQAKEKLTYRQQQLIQQRVDDRFAALREFVRGDATADNTEQATQSPVTPLNRVINTLNEEYTRQVITNSNLQQGDIPPLSEQTARLRAQMATWPAPVPRLLAPLLEGSFDNLQQRVVSTSLEAIADGPGAVCRRTLMGRYPFADSQQEVSLADFQRFFAKGGTVDSWFQQKLALRVDTSSSPWRYKGTQQTSGLDFFEQVEQIRQHFFDADGQKLNVDFSAAVAALSPQVSQFILNIDGNQFSYAHGPEVEQQLHWGGVQRPQQLTLIARGQQTDALPSQQWRGPWTLLHWLDNAESMRTLADDQILASWRLGPEPATDDWFVQRRVSPVPKVTLRLTGVEIEGRLLTEWLRDFRCPTANP